MTVKDTSAIMLSAVGLASAAGCAVVSYCRCRCRRHRGVSCSTGKFSANCGETLKEWCIGLHRGSNGWVTGGVAAGCFLLALSSLQHKWQAVVINTSGMVLSVVLSGAVFFCSKKVGSLSCDCRGRLQYKMHLPNGQPTCAKGSFELMYKTPLQPEPLQLTRLE